MPQRERGARVLDRVVRLLLDRLVQHKPREEAQREAPLPLDAEVDVDRVEHLLWRDEDVCGGRSEWEGGEGRKGAH